MRKRWILQRVTSAFDALRAIPQHGHKREKAMSEDRSDQKSNAPYSVGKVGISRRRLLGTTSLIAVSAVASTALPHMAASQTPSVLPKPEPPFEGKMERTVRDSTPDFPKGVEAP